LIGSSLYVIRLLIECLALSPISGTDDSDSLVADGETHGQDSTTDPAESEVARLGSTMCSVFREHEAWIIEDLCCEFEGDAMLGKVVTGLPLVPFELHRRTIVDSV
jgi:hypothetical protein